jgi:hypothetical protein
MMTDLIGGVVLVAAVLLLLWFVFKDDLFG